MYCSTSTATAARRGHRRPRDRREPPDRVRRRRDHRGRQAGRRGRAPVPRVDRPDRDRPPGRRGFTISTSGAAERKGIVHRLDVGTSGLMVVAKTEYAYTVLKRAFKERTVKKIYHALVQGHPDPFTGTVDAPIDRHPHHDYKFGVVAGGKPSVTHYETLEAFRYATLLEITLETGRTHQIRVHMAAIGDPCCGDLTYAPTRSSPSGSSSPASGFTPCASASSTPAPASTSSSPRSTRRPRPRARSPRRHPVRRFLAELYLTSFTTSALPSRSSRRTAPAGCSVRRHL